MCNQEVKFRLFLDTALEDGADMIATGHYSRVEDGQLLKAVDDNKDQTYFLYRVSGEALKRTLFPIGEFKKSKVRKMAEERGLSTAAKKDSQGICFVGQVGIRDFLRQYVQTEPGDIIDKTSGKKLGRHDGAIFYTLGQRHGLDVGGGLPYYVVGKDMDKNEVYVTTDLNDQTLWKSTIKLHSVHWISEAPSDGKYQIRVRHRAALVDADIKQGEAGIELELDQPQRAVTAGQSVVIYDGDVCLGGGVVK
jgi:tRNA-specific 2-thiouridylase